jgi:hypothetical protein
VNVATFPTRQQLENGITYAQAMDVWRRWAELEAAPTIADRTGIAYETVCSVLGGNTWRGAYDYWMDDTPRYR